MQSMLKKRKELGVHNNLVEELRNQDSEYFFKKDN